MGIREQIVEKARTYLGTPFHHQGRVKGIGIDCVGLVVEVSKELGLFGYDTIAYSRYPDGKTLMRELKEHLIEIPVGGAKLGDVLVFWISPKTKNLQHIGFKTDIGVIHTHEHVGKVVEHRLGSAWTKRLVHAFRLPGVD